MKYTTCHILCHNRSLLLILVSAFYGLHTNTQSNCFRSKDEYPKDLSKKVSSIKKVCNLTKSKIIPFI